MKIIKFISINENSQYFNNFPEPIKKNIPKWYKKIPKHINNEKKLNINTDFFPNVTIKSCMPFLDALTLGYVWKLPADIQISRENDILTIKWRLNKKWIETHPENQVPYLPAPIEANGDSSVFKFVVDFRIKVPKKYSILYTPPLNQYDLPIRIFSGVVENDLYPLEVNFPFQVVAPIKNGEVIFIDKDTPMVQIIPIKREKWIHVKLRDLNTQKFNFIKDNYLGTIKNAYKEQTWQKKIYE